MPFILLLTALWLRCGSEIEAAETGDYREYHQQVLVAERLIAKESYNEALSKYEGLFKSFDFVFLRDYQIATQLALFTGQNEKAMSYLRAGILSGWEIKSIKKNDFLSPLLQDQDWDSLEKEYPQLRARYESSLDSELRKRVKKMYSQDQKKALGALFRLSSASQDRYSENKFAPHSEQQMGYLSNILNAKGYPGEKLIGNDYWMSTILSHHNSISQNYVKQDTLYSSLKSKLFQALLRGEISPYEMALIDEWRVSTIGEDPKVGYSILDTPPPGMAATSNEFRKSVFLRSIEMHNSLLDIQEKTGMDLYLPDGWIDGKIEIE